MSLNIKRFEEATAYVAPNHFDVCGLRLQGMEAQGSEKLWVGVSHFLPGGGAGPDAGALEKVYVVLDGCVTLRIDDQEYRLERYDSVTIPANMVRAIKNESNQVATMLVAMPSPSTLPDRT